ncbi:MAG: hypothetical protein VKO00_00190 [Cyanobacteriota bacterium]|jgi:hypothetical protein|nr:hypothetical protein [Cyanobacteriota bacterium]
MFAASLPASVHDTLSQALEDLAEQGADAGLGPASTANGMIFLLIAALGVLMALVYVPIRLFLTITARSRRLKLLQRIRRLRDELARPPASPEL